MAKVIIQSRRLLKPSNKLPGGATASYSGFLGASLFKVGAIPTKSNLEAFLLNPESWTENKSAHWAQQATPGQSDPILQWIFSGPRTITFDALVTKDTANPIVGQATSEQITPNMSASIAAKICNAPVNNTADTKKRATQYFLDITDNLNYYRSLLYPIYSTVQLTASPPLVKLIVGSAFEKNKGKTSTVTSSQTLWVVTSLRINITKQLPNLNPLEAMVNFELMQYTLKPFGQSNFI